jgi:acetylglutamate kinase
MVVAGRLNVELCAALAAHDVRAVGLHAGSGAVRARRRPPRVVSGAGPDPIDMGLVGDVTGFDQGLLAALWQAGRVPVLSCLGLGDGGQVLNLNADLVASQLAAATGADALVAVTAVGGVRRDKDDPATRLARLTVAEARAAIAAGQVQGGMLPKLEEAFVPLAAGVRAVHIVAPSEIAAALTAPGTVGTMLIA